MARLGLSDSMCSTASLEDTEPLHKATHRQIPHRRHAAATSDTAEASGKHETKPKSTSFVLSNPLRVIVGSILAVVLLYAGATVFFPPLHAWRSSALQVEEQFEQLERSISLLYGDTARLKTTADRFLQHCQETHVAASTRKEMLQNVATRSFDEQVKMQTEEHAQVTREVLQYYVEQKQKIQETRERLIMMNISLPVEIAVRPVHKVWHDEQRMIQDGRERKLKRDDTRVRELFDAMEGLVFFAEKTQLQDKSDYQRFGVESISIQTGGHLESNDRQTTVGKSISYGSMFFYIFVVCASALYLWNAISDTRKELLKDKWSWSPVPKAVSRFKRLLGSVVVIEDLRAPTSDEVSHNSLKHIEHIEHIEY